MFERQTLLEIFLFLLPGLLVTLKIAAMAGVTAGAIGTVLGCAAAWGSAIVRVPLFVLLTFARGVPVLVQVFIAFFALPAMGLKLSAVSSATLTIVFFMSMTTMEVVRGGILGVPPHQILAARALGFSVVGSARCVILPQAFRIMLPSLVNQAVIVIKATSLASFIGVADVMLLAKESTERTQMGFETMGLVWLLYTCLCLPLTMAGRRLERSLKNKGFAS